VYSKLLYGLPKVVFVFFKAAMIYFGVFGVALQMSCQVGGAVLLLELVQEFF